MNFCPHGFGQKLDVLATISVLVWKTALFDLAMIVAAPQLRMTWFFFFVFREEEEGRREGRSMKIVTAKRSRLMEMGSNALDRNVERKREEVLDSSLCYSLLYEEREIFFWLWKIKGRENFRWTREGIVELKGCKSRWERRVCFYPVRYLPGTNWKREREGK